MKNEYIESIKNAIRVKGAFDDEIESYVESCRLDLQNAGISKETVENEEDTLVKTAIILYVKAMFGIEQKYSERDLQIYESIKISMKNSGHTSGGANSE